MGTFKLSAKARGIGVSGTLAVDERLQELKALGRDIIALGAGQPDFESPDSAREAGKLAIDEGKTRYTPVAGTGSLREVIARKLAQENGIAATADLVVVSSGAKHSLYNALLAVVDPEDEVLIPTPAWPSYAEMVRLVGGKPITIATSAATGYKLTAEALVRALGNRARKPAVILLNNPCNPTGALYGREEMTRLAEVIHGEDLHVIMDEIYEHIVYGKEFHSFAVMPGMSERTITVNGMSKAFSMTGWRIGYATGPAPVMQAMRAIQSHSSGNPTSISQEAAEGALRAYLDTPEGREPVEEMQRVFARRRDLVSRLLDDIPGVRFVPPDGAFYFFVDLSAHYGRSFGGKKVEGSQEMATYLLDTAGIGVVPGKSFGDDRCVRLSFAASSEDLSVAIKRMARALAK